ncbi:glutathione S-transferase 1-like [Amphiura filiformis]|uniref:glutathione S-transferase 1-like n=1 Tax=Amphiura filiformis TaxID=82378 RepID=UPI003B2174CD
MPQYKLFYFISKGRAESIRLMFHISETEFEDVRIMHVDWLPKYKAEMPFGQVPVLEVDGEKLTQVKAVARYVAKQTGFYGKNDIECAKIDEVIDLCEDWHRPINDTFLVSPEEKEYLLKKIGKLSKEICNNLLEILKRGKGTYFVGDRLTLADLYVFGDLEFLSLWVDNMLKDFPKLVEFRDRIAAEPKVAEWMAKRPESQY